MIYMTFVFLFLTACMLWAMFKYKAAEDKLEDVERENKRLQSEIINYCRQKRDHKIKIDASEVMEYVERRMRTWMQ